MPTCHHGKILYGGCINCRREARECYALIAQRLGGTRRAMAEMGDALAGLRLPYGYSVEVVAVHDEVSLRLSQARPITIEGVYSHE
jgi:hypothetical protein